MNRLMNPVRLCGFGLFGKSGRGANHLRAKSYGMIAVGRGGPVSGEFARAGSITWGSSSGGNFNVGTNWAGGTAPSTGSDWAYFSNNTLTNGTITMASNTSIEGMTMNNTSGILNFNLGASTTYSLSLYLIMGDNTTTPLENMGLDLTSGTMNSNLALIGNDPNSTATVTVSGANSAFNASGSVRIGSDGGNNSVMTLNGGAQFTSAGLWVGLQTATGCVLTVTDPGTKMSISGDAQVAGANEGATVGGNDQINVLNGGELDLGRLLVGVGDTTAVDNENIIVSGTNSLLKVSGSNGSSNTAVYLGLNYSDNHMTIENGGSFLATHGDVALGVGAASTGNSLTVSGGNFTLTGTGLASGQGRLNITKGTFTLSGGIAVLPALLATTSTSTVQLNSGTADVANATVSNGSPLVLGDGISSTATYDMTSPTGTHTFSNGLQIQSNGVLTGAATIVGNVSNGGAVAVGSEPTTPGTIDLTGNYSQTSAGTLDIGLDGTTPGTQFDDLDITGTASLAGTLDVDSEQLRTLGHGIVRHSTVHWFGWNTILERRSSDRAGRTVERLLHSHRCGYQCDRGSRAGIIGHIGARRYPAASPPFRLNVVRISVHPAL